MHRYPRWPIHLALLLVSFVMLVPFYFLFGSWVDDPAVDAALADQRAIDTDLWK